MKLAWHRITDDGFLEVLPEGSMAAALADPEGQYWLDVMAPTPAELHELLDDLDLHPLIWENLLEPDRSTRVTPLRETLFFEFAVLPPPGGEGRADDLRREYLSLVCRRGLIVSIHQAPLSALDRLMYLLDGHIALASPSLPALLYEIVDAMVDDATRRALSFRSQVQTLGQLAESDPEQLPSRRLLALEGQVDDLASKCEDQLFVILSLQTTESSFFRISGQREYFREVQSNLEQDLRLIGRLQSRLDDLRLYTSLTLNDRTARRLALLTIISAVFTPLTFISSVYGMNFDYMPELQVWWAYPAVLGLMLLLAGSLLTFFWWRGWFRVKS